MKSLLTEIQTKFLNNNSLEKVISNEGCTRVFINELFDIESQDTPLQEPLFLTTIFEFVNCFLYLYAPSEIIPTYNKQANIAELTNDDSIKKISNKNTEELNIGILNLQELEAKDQILVRYVVNPFKMRRNTTITIGKNSFTFHSAVKNKPKILSYSIKYVIENPNEFLFKMVNIYNELIEIMPLDELVV